MPAQTVTFACRGSINRQNLLVNPNQTQSASLPARDPSYEVFPINIYTNPPAPPSKLDEMDDPE
jgi:hypothetical protein